MANLNADNKFGVTGALVLNLTIVGAIVLTNFYEVNKLLYLLYTVIIGGFFQALVLFTVVDRNLDSINISKKISNKLKRILQYVLAHFSLLIIFSD